MSNLVLTLARVVELLIWAYIWVIIARAVVSWVNPDPFNPIVRFLYRATEPVLRPIRHRMPAMGLDLSPMIVILVLYLLEGFLVSSLRDLALSLR